ncbi:MAG: FAD-binding oxidoreductase [Thermoleophilaceae bacterium]
MALDAVKLPEPALSSEQRRALEAIVGADNVGVDRAARVRRAAGRGYPDLLRLRSGRPEGAPDAVVWPADHDEVRGVLEHCADEGIAVVPFGGGTSVVGGVDPVRGPFAAVIALDLARMAAVTALDERSLTAGVGPGLRAPEADRILAARGLTLGHLPQSYEYVSLGGAVATRSAGQASTGFGRIDELVVGITLAAPAGEVVLAPTPASAAGPRLRDLLVGSEGVLGVITGIDLRVRRVAPWRYEGWFAPTFGEGMEALRGLEQSECAPAIARLSDEEETRVGLAMAGGGPKARAFAAYLRARRVSGGCLVVAGWAGDDERTAPDRAQAARILRAHGAVAVGAAPARAWASGRFRAPYLRDALLDHGVLVETLETAGQWSNLARALHGGARSAARRAGSPRHAGPGLVPRLPPLRHRRVALLHLPRPSGGRSGDRAVAGGEGGGKRGRRPDGRHDHPPSRGRPRPRALDGRRGRHDGARPPPCRQGAPRSHGDHEPRQAAAGVRRSGDPRPRASTPVLRAGPLRGEPPPSAPLLPPVVPGAAPPPLGAAPPGSRRAGCRPRAGYWSGVCRPRAACWSGVCRPRAGCWSGAGCSRRRSSWTRACRAGLSHQGAWSSRWSRG